MTNDFRSAYKKPMVADLSDNDILWMLQSDMGNAVDLLTEIRDLLRVLVDKDSNERF